MGLFHSNPSNFYKLIIIFKQDYHIYIIRLSTNCLYIYEDIKIFIIDFFKFKQYINFSNQLLKILELKKHNSHPI